ncbi:MAG: hypothetical protein Q7U70_05190 [Methylotenera sp.]|nr:hypothetical protein [Methylotenera sp.]MDO9389159.1 hypothetical protein [Methylotenera sp.]
MANISAKEQAVKIFQSATPVIKIHGVGGKQWKRNIAKNPNDARIGPWLQGKYDILDEKVWREKGACLYLVAGSDSNIRYVGISRNGLKHRWRTSPAYDAVTMQKLPDNQIFHSQCWKNIERESLTNPNITFEIRCISSQQISAMHNQLSPKISSLVEAFRDDGESIVAGIERWFCNGKSTDFLSWNVAMTGR